MKSGGRVTPVILSGGSGVRLRPLSRLGRPKQFIALHGASTMLQSTARRTDDADLFTSPVVVASAEHGEAIEAQLADVGMPPSMLILEPCARNTAPATALVALNADPDDLLLVMPSDHLVTDTAAFRAAVEAALPMAGDGWLVTFGVTASRPETGYGYILRGERLASGVFRAARFVEKPTRDVAEAYVADGCYCWNAGIFLFRAGALLDALEQDAPYLLDLVRAAVKGQSRDGMRIRPDAQLFASAPAQSIDHAIMEKSKKVAVVPVEMGWSDIGSWSALHDIGVKDPQGNVLDGEVIAIDSEGCLVRSEGPVIVTIGVNDLIVVATERSVLIVPREQSQRVQEAVEALKEKASSRTSKAA